MSLLSASPPLRDLSGRQMQWIAAGYMLTLSSLPGQTIFIAQFNASIRAEFNLGHGDFALIYMLATLASSVCLVWAGALTDRIPARRIAAFCLAGLALMAIAMASVHHVAFLVIVLFGLRLFGQGMMGQIALTTMGRWFNRYRGRAMALAQLGYPTGDAFLPIIITLTIAAIGWRASWYASAGVLIGVMIPVVYFLLRDPPDGARAKAAGVVNPDAADSGRPTGQRWTRGRVLRDPLFYMAIPGFMGPPAIGTLYIFHQAHLAEIKGWDPAIFAAFFPALSISAVIFAIISGILIDRFGAWRIVPVVLLPQALGCLVIGLLDPIWSIPLLLALFGMTSGLSQPIVGALWAELYGTAHLGAVRALASSFFVFASALGPGLSGVLIDARFELTSQSFMYAGFCLVASIGYLLIRSKFAARVQQTAADRDD